MTTVGQLHGDLDSWSAGLLLPCAKSSYLTFAIGIGFAGPCVDFVKLSETVAFDFYGDSGSGKTTCLLAIQSVHGAAQPEDLPTLDQTDLAIEEWAAAHNNLACPIDEFARLEASAVSNRQRAAKLAHVLTSGKGRRRSRWATTDPLLQNRSWRSVFAISREKTPEARVMKSRGVVVRMPEITVPGTAVGGIFDGAAGKEEAVELATRVEKTIEDNFGVALPAFLTQLTANLDHWQAEFKRHFDLFIRNRAHGAGRGGPRFAKKFALVYAASAIAAEMEVAPFTKKQARVAVSEVFRRACDAARTVDEDADAIVRELKDVANDKSRFPIVEARKEFPVKAAKTAWGIRRTVSERKCLCVDPASPTTDRLWLVTRSTPSSIRRAWMRCCSMVFTLQDETQGAVVTKVTARPARRSRSAITPPR